MQYNDSHTNSKESKNMIEIAFIIYQLAPDLNSSKPIAVYTNLQRLREDYPMHRKLDWKVSQHVSDGQDCYIVVPVENRDDRPEEATQKREEHLWMLGMLDELPKHMRV